MIKHEGKPAQASEMNARFQRCVQFPRGFKILCKYADKRNEISPLDFDHSMKVKHKENIKMNSDMLSSKNVICRNIFFLFL